MPTPWDKSYSNNYYCLCSCIDSFESVFVVSLASDVFCNQTCIEHHIVLFAMPSPAFTEPKSNLYMLKSAQSPYCGVNLIFRIETHNLPIRSINVTDHKMCFLLKGMCIAQKDRNAFAYTDWLGSVHGPCNKKMYLLW